MSSLKKISINSLFGFLSQLIQMTLKFVVRIYFVNQLGATYLGLTGLYSNILSVLALGELGIGSTITYMLYKPICDGDISRINGYMSYFRRLYRIVGFSTLLIGVVISCFLDSFIKDTTISMNIVMFSFYLYLINTVSSYFLSYRNIILLADEKEYIRKVVLTVSNVIQAMIQIFILLSTSNILLYLVVQVIFTLLSNITLYFASKQLYPDITCDRENQISEIEKNSVFVKVRAMMIHNLSGVVTHSTDNIVISSFVSLTSVGLYSNYVMVVSSINILINQFILGTLATIGKKIVGYTSHEIYRLYRLLNFITSYIYIVASIMIMTLIEPFIKIWLGDSMLLPFNVVILMIINFYLLGIRTSLLIIRNSSGTFTLDRIAPTIKPFINIFLSVILVTKIGISGVLIGTMISSIISDVIITPYLIFKHLLKRSIADHIINLALNIVMLIISAAITLSISSFIFYKLDFMLGTVIMITVDLVVTSLIYLLFNFQSYEFKYCIAVLSKLKS